ncbi:MAG: alpha amylase C-terminal domain-containing protein, partial [Saprospiraceae bacterium]|nr:alpha amylase C-terminal domain-containing protein [Saprospiraceae bacterium]
GNEVRHFVALFLNDMPSYMGLGFECRDPHPEPAPNEHYTKLYVFRELHGPKSTSGPYQWGKNTVLYNNLVRQRLLSDKINDRLVGRKIQWLIPPDTAGRHHLIAWTQTDQPEWVFVANFNTTKTEDVRITFPAGRWRLIFSTTSDVPPSEEDYAQKESLLVAPGEGLVFNCLPA